MHESLGQITQLQRRSVRQSKLLTVHLGDLEGGHLCVGIQLDDLAVVHRGDLLQEGERARMTVDELRVHGGQSAEQHVPVVPQNILVARSQKVCRPAHQLHHLVRVVVADRRVGTARRQVARVDHLVCKCGGVLRLQHLDELREDDALHRGFLLPVDRRRIIPLETGLLPG